MPVGTGNQTKRSGKLESQTGQVIITNSSFIV